MSVRILIGDCRDRLKELPAGHVGNDHPAPMAAELARRCIVSSSSPGDTVLDPFLGSGTTAIVADQIQRNCIGIELNPKFAADAERRIRNEAGMCIESAA
jgi:DNA modification methylase